MRFARISQRDVRRVRVGSVGDDLKRRRPARRDVLAVPRRNRQRHPGVARLEISIDVPRVGHNVDDVEDARSGEPADEILAAGAAIGVHDDDRHVAHVSGRRVAENGELEHGRDEDDAEDARILAQLEDLLPHHERSHDAVLMPIASPAAVDASASMSAA